MTIGQILIKDKFKGSGFALAAPHSESTRVALTALHVIDNQETPSVRFLTQFGQSVPVEYVESDKDLDIALLHLGEDISGGLVVDRATEGMEWQVQTRPLSNDPKLTGTVTATRRQLEKSQGQNTTISVLQLQVDQNLDSYKGYSGSPVVLKQPPGPVIGVLVEQLLSRLSVLTDQPRRATNVLYAVPIQDVLERFNLLDVPTASVTLFRGMKFDVRKVEEQLNKLQARTNAINRNLQAITEQRDNGIIDVGRFLLLENNLNRQRTEILQEATRVLEGLDEDFDGVLLSAAAGEQESTLMERLSQIAVRKGLTRQLVASLERQQGTLLFWLMEVGKQLTKQAN
jgi:hypothetical protein